MLGTSAGTVPEDGRCACDGVYSMCIVVVLREVFPCSMYVWCHAKEVYLGHRGLPVTSWNIYLLNHVLLDDTFAINVLHMPHNIVRNI